MGKITTEWLEGYVTTPEFKEVADEARVQGNYDLIAFMHQVIEASKKTHLSTAKATVFECLICGKRFERKAWQVAKNERRGHATRFCSKECSLVNASRTAKAGSRKVGRKKGPVPDHGQLARYTNYKCRCDLCRNAMSEYNRRKRPGIRKVSA